MSAFSIALDKVSCRDKAVTPPTSDPCCCFLLSTSNSSMAPEEVMCGLGMPQTLSALLAPVSSTALSQEQRDRNNRAHNTNYLMGC